MDFITQYLPRILVGVAVLIPLVIALIKYVKKAADDKNWNIIVKMVLDLMVQAEKDYSTGAEKKCEGARVDYVAYTRAMNSLMILTPPKKNKGKWF